MANGQYRYFSSLRALLFSPAIRQLIFLSGVALSTGLGFYLFNMVKEPIYRPVGFKVTQKNIAAITDTLDKKNIHYKINSSDGTLLVDENDMASARLSLSSAGISKDDDFNFSYLNDPTGFGNSQFQEGARYIRALEADLERTISGIEGISNSRVHIAIPRNNVFADENKKPTASILVNIRPGLSSDREKIRAIVQIVASSVPGLDPKDVSITDQFGHFLSSALDEASISNSEQLNYQNNIQTYYEKRIESMITPIVGSNKVNVRVFADIDFTQEEEASEQYDPDKKAIRSEQQLTEESGNSSASGTPGALSNTPPDSGAGKPAGAQSSMSEGKSQSIKNYEVSKSVTYKKTTQPKIISLSAAVIIDNETIVDQKSQKTISKPLEKQKIDKIEDIIKTIIGYSEKRGDKISILNSSFQSEKIEIVEHKVGFWEQPWFWDIIKKSLGILFGFIILLSLYLKLSKYAKNLPPIDISQPAANFDDVDQLSSQLKSLKENRLEKLKEMAGKDPNKVALIIKDWVGK